MQDAVPTIDSQVEQTAMARDHPMLNPRIGVRLVEGLPAAVYLACADRQDRWLYASPRVLAVLGYEAQAFTSEPGLWAQLIHPEDRATVLDTVAQAISGATVALEYRMVRRDGQIIWVADSAELGPYGAHSEIFHGMLTDITARRREEMHLAAQVDIAGRVIDGAELSSTLVALARRTEQASGAARCLIQLDHGSPSSGPAGPLLPKLMISAHGARESSDASTPVPSALQAGFTTADGSYSGRVMLHYRPGAVVQVADSELVSWVAELASIAAAGASQRLRISNSLALLAATLDSTTDGILVLDLTHQVVGHNRKFLDMWNIGVDVALTFDTAQLLEAAALLLPPGERQTMLAPQGLEDHSDIDELVLLDGRIIERYQHIEHGSSATENIGRVWSFRDVTAHRLMQQELRDQARNDPLTPLANRAMFVEQLTTALRSHPRSGATLAVLLLDLDDFKTVNDGLGYAAGDKLLIAVADRLRGCLRQRDVAARLSGDEFVVLLEDLVEPAEASYAAERILTAVSRPLTIDGQVLTVRASVGIAVLQADENAAEMLRNADLAMYTAKRGGGSSCRQYAPDMHAEAVARMELKTDLERAINAEQLAVHYQPVVDLGTGRILGVEALVRWNHPIRGPIPPVDFIPLAEQTGLIERLGRWVLRQACTDTAVWRRTIPGQEDLSVSVNLSPRQLSNVNFPDDVRRVLWASGLPATALILEITESTLAEPGVDAVKALQELKQIGLSLALDDFGTGYSSLAQLVKYPLDVVKVDKSFVDHIDGDPANSALTKAVLNIAKALSLSVTVEGIETREQLRLLFEMGARRGQGYLMARPLPGDEVSVLLEELRLLSAAG